MHNIIHVCLLSNQIFLIKFKKGKKRDEAYSLMQKNNIFD